ncbi:hypothetical protein J4422_01475 [Candidatus Pacearchaeota archaeon]|nr:hypothetical protein [Candidatus Pacearchaeota archaeon]
MGLFGKDKKEEKKKDEIPQLPSLPKLPEFPGFEEDSTQSMQIHRLPSFPSGSLGTKFSQNTIKEAVTGEERGDFSNEDANDFEDEDVDTMRVMQKPLKKPLTEELGNRRFPSGFSGGMAPEQVFIRIDKFENAMSIFNQARKKISEIEATLEEIKGIKEKEDRELEAWENEIKSMKDQIEKVDRDIFSRV